ncbi:MAG UNVERIFIED_CONTAM: hypothetical protein LVT10_14200 [Anaerolineae bacterium]
MPRSATARKNASCWSGAVGMWVGSRDNQLPPFSRIGEVRRAHIEHPRDRPLCARVARTNRAPPGCLAATLGQP